MRRLPDAPQRAGDVADASVVSRTRARGFRLATIAALLLGATAARAQVNIESLRNDLRARPAIATIEGSFTGRSGNVQSIVLGGGASGAARVGRSGFLGSMQGDYTSFSGETRVSKSFIHLRYSYALLDWLSPEVFAQQQQDKFQRLQVREIIGAGPRFILADENELRIALGTAYMFEYERISVPAGAPDWPTGTAQQSSTYLTSTWQPDARVRLMGTVYVQPRWVDFSDVRTLVEASLTTQIVGRLAVKVLFTLRHDSAPPTTVKTTDVEVKNAFVVQF